MKTGDKRLGDIWEKELQLQSLIAESNKQILAQGFRLVSMYISLYKKHFGELTPNLYQPLLSTDAINEDSAQIFAGGLSEAIAMLHSVIQSNIVAESSEAKRLMMN